MSENTEYNKPKDTEEYITKTSWGSEVSERELDLKEEIAASTGSLDYPFFADRTNPTIVLDKDEYRASTNKIEFAKNVPLSMHTLDGEVEKIIDDLALVVFKINDGYIERQIPIRKLQTKNADFEGAQIRLHVIEKPDETISYIEKQSEDFTPKWTLKDDEMKDVFKTLKNSRKKLGNYSY